MTKPISEIKKEAEKKLTELRIKRKSIVSNFKKSWRRKKLSKLEIQF